MLLIGNQAQEEFAEIFRIAQKEITDLLENYIALEVPGYELGRQRVLLKQVDEILQKTDEPVLQWIEDWLPQSYEKGTLYTTRGLKKLGVATEADMRAGFGVIDREQVMALAESMVRDVDGAQAQILSNFAQGIRASQLDVAADVAASQQTAVAIAKGEGIQGIRARLLEKVLKGEIAPGGYKGSLSNYAELLARTRAAEAQTLGMIRRMADFGEDLVRVIGDGESCVICSPWDNVVFSLSGNDPRFPALATVGPPPWHPNCDHRLAPFVADLASSSELSAAEERAAQAMKKAA